MTKPGSMVRDIRTPTLPCRGTNPASGHETLQVKSQLTIQDVCKTLDGAENFRSQAWLGNFGTDLRGNNTYLFPPIIQVGKQKRG